MPKIRNPKRPSRLDTNGFSSGLAANPEILPQQSFHRVLSLERKRSERSLRRFVLMLLDCGSLLRAGNTARSYGSILDALSESTRETDVRGWYKDGSIIGVLFTELGAAEGTSVASALLTKTTNALCRTLSIEQINEITLSFHVYPDTTNGQGGPTDSTLYPDLVTHSHSQKDSLRVKRSMDVVGSLLAIILCSPILLLLAAAIKLTSRGPILFSQQRTGQYGNRFTFFKFRSMYFKSDHTIHHEYIKRLISAKSNCHSREFVPGQAFKLVADPRVTPVGRFLRRTSLDELPQLFNILSGDMSLVGPRPPIPYEVEAYHAWHKQRLLAAKPGLTGLWQIEGRSRVSFDEMVRMDLRYARSWSIWLDIKILLKTPKAVLSGAGAY
jgi:lipopolysaccharide/colanic/teichoic acid biosynthesis glycosyltransferase